MEESQKIGIHMVDFHRPGPLAEEATESKGGHFA